MVCFVRKSNIEAVSSSTDCCLRFGRRSDNFFAFSFATLISMTPSGLNGEKLLGDVDGDRKSDDADNKPSTRLVTDESDILPQSTT